MQKDDGILVLQKALDALASARPGAEIVDEAHLRCRACSQTLSCLRWRGRAGRGRTVFFSSGTVVPPLVTSTMRRLTPPPSECRCTNASTWLRTPVHDEGTCRASPPRAA
jgi:hypothetical protein